MGNLFGGGSAPAPSASQVKAEAVRDRETRREEFAKKKRSSSGIRRRRGRSLLISDKETGIGSSSTLG
jgi:hypothetical protein